MSDVRASDLARMLSADVAALVRELLPAGRKDGHEWVHPSLSGTSRRSLSVRLAGPKAGVWSDFASGEAGDALDLVAHVLYRGNRREAIAWARRRLGLTDTQPPPAEPRRAPSPPPPAAEDDTEAEARRGAARQIFLAAERSLAGTPAAAYLAARGIDLAELGRQPGSLRFHRNLHNREAGRSFPALVAAVTSSGGDMIALHRTWLAQDAAGRWAKAPLRYAKMSLGPLSGGTIRLWRGASGRPLAKAPDGEAVIVAEGIETALSCALLCPEFRVLSAVSLPNMAKVELPAAVREVIIAADNDGDNQAAARGLRRAIDHFRNEGRTVRLARSPVGKDFNDLLKADGP